MSLSWLIDYTNRATPEYDYTAFEYLKANVKLVIKNGEIVAVRDCVDIDNPKAHFVKLLAPRLLQLSRSSNIDTRFGIDGCAYLFSNWPKRRPAFDGEEGTVAIYKRFLDYAKQVKAPKKILAGIQQIVDCVSKPLSQNLLDGLIEKGLKSSDGKVSLTAAFSVDVINESFFVEDPDFQEIWSGYFNTYRDDSTGKSGFCPYCQKTGKYVKKTQKLGIVKGVKGRTTGAVLMTTEDDTSRYYGGCDLYICSECADKVKFAYDDIVIGNKTFHKSSKDMLFVSAIKEVEDFVKFLNPEKSVSNFLSVTKKFNNATSAYGADMCHIVRFGMGGADTRFTFTEGKDIPASVMVNSLKAVYDDLGGQAFFNALVAKISKTGIRKSIVDTLLEEFCTSVLAPDEKNEIHARIHKKFDMDKKIYSEVLPKWAESFTEFLLNSTDKAPVPSFVISELVRYFRRYRLSQYNIVVPAMIRLALTRETEGGNSIMENGEFKTPEAKKASDTGRLFFILSCASRQKQNSYKDYDKRESLYCSPTYAVKNVNGIKANPERFLVQNGGNIRYYCKNVAFGNKLEQRYGEILQEIGPNFQKRLNPEQNIAFEYGFYQEMKSFIDMLKASKTEKEDKNEESGTCEVVENNQIEDQED